MDTKNFVKNGTKLSDSLSPSSSESSAFLSTSTEKLGLSFETGSKIELMEVDSLEDILSNAPHETPPSISKKYLEWQETLASMANPRKKRNNEDSPSSSQSRQSSDEDQEGDRNLEEFGLETLEEPDYHDSECDIDHQCDDQANIKIPDNEQFVFLDVDQDFTIIDDVQLNSINDIKTEKGPIFDPVEEYELNIEGNIVHSKQKIYKICNIMDQDIPSIDENIFREPSDSTMSDSENSVAVKEFLYTVHCTPKLRLVEDANKNKLLIMEPLETIDEENTDDLQKDIQQYDHLKDYWEDDQDQHQQLDNSKQLEISLDQDDDYTFKQVEIPSNKTQFVNLAGHGQVGTTIGEELFLDDTIDEFASRSHYPTTQPLVDSSGSDDLNLSRLSSLGFSDAEHVFNDDDIDDDTFVHNCPAEIREIIEGPIFNDEILPRFSKTSLMEPEVEEEEFSECETTLDVPDFNQDKINYFISQTDQPHSDDLENEEELEETFSDDLNDLPTESNQVLIEGQDSPVKMDELKEDELIKINSGLKENSDEILKQTQIMNIINNNVENVELITPSIESEKNSVKSCDLPNEKSQNELINKEKLLEQEKICNVLLEAKFVTPEPLEEEEKDEEMESLDPVPDPQVLETIGDSRWSHMEEYIDILYVKIDVPSLKNNSSTLLTDKNETQKIISFPLHVDDADSIMVLAINSHLPQLHAHFVDTPKQVEFKFPKNLSHHQSQNRFLIGIIKIHCPLSIPISFKLNSVYQLTMTPDMGVVFPQEVVHVKIHCKLNGLSQFNFIEQLKIEGILVYSAPFIFNRGFSQDNLEFKHVKEFWRKLEGPRFQFVQTRFIPIQVTGEPVMKQVKCGLLESIWNTFKYLTLNIFRCSPPPTTSLRNLSPSELMNTEASPIGQVILRRHINIYRLLESRWEGLNNYRTMLITSTILCAVGATLFYFLIYKPEMIRQEFLTRISSNFWPHVKSVLPRLFWARH